MWLVSKEHDQERDLNHLCTSLVGPRDEPSPIAELHSFRIGFGLSLLLLYLREATGKQKIVAVAFDEMRWNVVAAFLFHLWWTLTLHPHSVVEGVGGIFELNLGSLNNPFGVDEKGSCCNATKVTLNKSGAVDNTDNNNSNNNNVKDSHVEVTRIVEPQVLARLESQFLKLFGMPRKPHKRSKPLKVPKYLIELYNAQTDSELGTSNLNLPGRHTRTANTVRTFYHKYDDSEVEWGHRVKFDLSSIPEKEKVTGAELRLVFSKIDTTVHPVLQSDKVSSEQSQQVDNYDSVHVLVNDVIKPPKGGESEPIMFPIDSKLIDLRKRRNDSFWITLDVFPAVSRWVENPKGNHGVVIQVVRPNGQVMSQATLNHIRVRRDTSVNAQSASENDPVLFTYSDDGVNKKQRDATALSRAYRAANNGGNGGNGNGNKKRKNHRKNRKRNLCSRHKMFVDFTDVGWNDWIVAPPALVNSMNPQMVPPPCCVPTKYSSLSLLYTDSSDKIVLKNYNEMVVDACGCS